MMIFVLLSSLPLLLNALATTTVYLIRHGEKPETGNGLNAQGVRRAQCLQNVFGNTSSYAISHIMAQTPKLSNGEWKRQRPLDTVKPLANDLGLPVDTSCDRDDSDCVRRVVVDQYEQQGGNILICWEHKKLVDIVHALGDAHAPAYPHDRFDLIYSLSYPYNHGKVDITSERCPGLDDGGTTTGS